MSSELMRLLLRVLAAALLLLLSSSPALAALTYHLTLDSSSLAGQQGFLDVQLIPGESPGAPSAIATLSDFMISGGALGAPVSIDGDVTGNLPGEVTLGNGTALNAILQPLSPVGNSISLQISFAGDFLTTPSSIGTSFSLALLDAQLNPLLSGDANGRLVVFDLADGAAPYNDFSERLEVAAVPEAEAWVVLLVGICAAGAVARRRLY
jgi:hypothetical protein